MGEDALAVRPTWFTRLLRGVGLLPSGEIAFEAGADFAASQPAHPGYPKGDSMSAMAAFPWVYSCVSAISDDLSGLPLIAIRGEGADAERLDSHPVLDLLAQPSTRVSSQLFRKQLICDYILSGDAYALIAGEREPAALLRLIPQRVTVKPWADGQPGQYLYDSGGNQRDYTWEEVLHLRSPSWEDDTSSLRALRNRCYPTARPRSADRACRAEERRGDREDRAPERYPEPGRRRGQVVKRTNFTHQSRVLEAAQRPERGINSGWCCSL